MLVFQEHSDKSVFLSLGGYALENWEDLENDLRFLIETEEAFFQKSDLFGEYFEVRGELRGGVSVKTVWLRERGTAFFRFITLIPKSRNDEI